MRFRTTAGALAVFLATGLPAFAQDAPQSLTWIAYSMTKPGQLQAAVAAAREYDAPLLDRLMADGTVQSWGMATPVNHKAGFDWNLLTWVTLPDWAAAEKWTNAVGQAMAGRSPEEAAAAAERDESLYVERSHYDEVLVNVVVQMADPGGSAPQFILGGNYKAREGRAAAGNAAFDRWWPTADAMLAEGTILGYGLQAQWLHTNPDFTVRDWYMLPSLGSLDAFFAKAQADWSAQDQAAFEAAFSGDAHDDVLLMVLHNGGTPAPE